MSSGVLENIREEDFVEYFLFPHLNANENTLKNDEVDLNKVFVEVQNIISSYSHSYIWHKDEFIVTPRLRNSNLLFENEGQSETELPPHLYGITHYGDNIQDEWFIVFLLIEITKRIPGMIGRIIDSDGEFLLIEAADHLPKWASPETCEQRVYIFDGAIQLVQNSPSNTSTLLNVSDAIKKILKNPKLYKVTSNIQKCIDDRIVDYHPDKISDHLHKATVYLPLGVAALLKNKPSFISAAVRSFCNRDVIDMKACRAMRYFPPENRVYTNVTFSKCLYAMLVQNNYVPDRRTGWNLPPTNRPQFKSHNLGVRLACGFEILASQAKPSINLADDKGWNKYIESLIKKGYFQENIEGSKDYLRLLEAAKSYYINNRDSMYYSSSIGREVISLLQSLDYNIEEFKKLEQTLPESDDDSWINITPEALDEMLTKRYGVKKIFSVNGNMNTTNFTEQINEFLEQKSEFDGIDYHEKDLLPVRPKRGVKKTNDTVKSTSEDDGGATIDFDPEGFQSQVKNLLDLIIPEDNWESNSEMSDYEDDDDIDKNIEDMGSSKTNIKTNLKKYMDQMDQELAKTTIGKSFERKAGADDGFDDIEDFTPVDIDMNTVKNMVESYQSQMGGPGPASNLLSSMGIKIKQDVQTENQTENPISQV